MLEQRPRAHGEPVWRAIVIGTDAYPQLLPNGQLRGCVNDATAMRAFLMERLGIPAACIRFLAAPVVEGSVPSTAANIRAALRELEESDGLRAGDHVVLYYACHGVRLYPESATADGRSIYGIAATDVSRSSSGYANLVLDRELNHFLRAMRDRRIIATVIADTCHAGSSTRAAAALLERYLPAVKPLTDREWQRLVTTHPALAADPLTAVNRDPAGGAERLGRHGLSGADFVVLAACQDMETAKEVYEEVIEPSGERAMIPRGALTLGLLDALRRVPPEQIRSLRWIDLYDELRRSVLQRVAAVHSTQRPALEGSPERPVFGGSWTAFAPGFNVRKLGNQYHVDGGTIHGLDKGAELALYPEESADLAAAAGPAARAVIEDAALSTSIARLTDPDPPAAETWRARLAALAPGTAPLLLRVRDLPSELVRELESEACKGLLALVAPDAPAHVEVRRYERAIPESVWSADPERSRSWAGARGGWVLVRSDIAGAPALQPDDRELAADDIIAYLPSTGPRLKLLKGDLTSRLAAALREGLLHYAQYLRTRDRSGGDQTLRSLLDVKLLVGSAADVPAARNVDQLPADLLRAGRRIDPQAGVYRLKQGQWALLEIQALRQSGLRLFAGLVACCDVGLVIPVWPVQGQRFTLEVGRTVHLGEDRFNPMWLNSRPDQSVTCWTLKLIAYTAPEDSDPINIHSLAQPQSVQEVFDACLTPSARDLRVQRIQPPRPAWYTWNLRLTVEK